jgi:hypothetical protein
MTEPNKWIVRPFADVGTNEPFLSRLSIGLTDILNATLYPNRDEIRNSITELAVECVLPAFLSLRELRRIAGDAKAPILTKQKHCDDMYKSLWAAYKDRTSSTAKLMGYDIGFLYQKDSSFEQGCAAFPKAHPEVSDGLVPRMKNNRTSWQNSLARFRNDYLEHKTIERSEVEVFYSLDRAEVTFQTVWVAIEEILATLLAARLPSMAALREIPEAERNPQMPLRFGWAWARPPKSG